jgi:hypothetical protein
MRDVIAERINARIEQARKVLEPKRVRKEHIPQWLKTRMRCYLRAQGKPYGDFYSAVVGIVGSFSFLDHYGTIDSGNVFVSEPYLLPQHVILAEAFASRLGILFSIDANSYHFPGRTTRLRFQEPKGGVK